MDLKLNKKPKPAGGKRKPEKVDKNNELWLMTIDIVNKGLEARRPFERIWILSLAFLHGRQHSFFNSSAHMLQNIQQKRGKARVIDNQLISRWKRQVHDLIRSKPTMSVVPDSNDDKDIQAANAGEKFMKHFWRSASMGKKIRKLGGWIHGTGNGFLVDTWNPRLGPEKVDKETGKIIYAGDADVSVWSPFEILVPSGAQSEVDDGEWVTKRRWKQLSYIVNYHKKGKYVKAEDKSANVIELTYMLDSLTGETFSQEDGAYLIDLYIKPCSKYPKGKFIVASNGIILEESDYPFNYYPIEHFKDIELPGVFWGYPTLYTAIPLQKIWNDTVTDIKRYNDVMAKGKWMAPRGSAMEELPNNETGEVIEYTVVQGRKPEHVDLKGLPSTVDGLLSIVAKSLQDLFSQHEVSQGTNKSDIRSGEMVGLLLEQDSIGTVGTHAIFEESLQATMGRVLKRVQNGYDMERMIKIRGQEGDFEVISFKGADLRNNTDVHVVKQSSLSESRVQRESQVISRYQAGLYGDPADPEVRRHVMRMLEDAVVKDIYSDTILDESYARYENRLLNEGKDIYLVNNYDNHGIHLKEHRHFRKSLEYQKGKLDPKTQEEWMQKELIFTEHEKVHQDFLADQQAKMLAQAAQAKGVK